MPVNRQLQQRLLTAAVLVPLFLGAVLWLPTAYIMALFALVVCQGAWEWSALVGMRGTSLRLLYVAAVLAVLLQVPRLMDSSVMLQTLLGLATAWWIAALSWVRRSEMAGGVASEVTQGVSWPLALAGMVVLVPVWVALVVLHANGTAGVWLLLTLMGIVWGADSGAYFAGRRWGRHKLASHISPGKTWEGVGGGVAAALLIALLAAWLMDFSGTSMTGFALLAVVTALFSIVGDLLESLLKRRCGVKDSGSLLPGHGGILDRIDSLTAAAPVYTLGLMMEGIRL